MLSMASSRLRFVAAFAALLPMVAGGSPLAAQSGADLAPADQTPDAPNGLSPENRLPQAPFDGPGLTAPGSPMPSVPPAPGEAPQDQGALEKLYRDLADPGNPNWAITESDVQREWSKSGSPTMDLLLRRGREALQAGDLDAAIEHLTALTDHAPDFPEGWNARATAFFMKGRLGLAVWDIQHTLVLNPHHYGALAGLGLIFEQLDRPDMALKAYRASLAINPHQVPVLEAVGRLESEDAGTAL